MYKYINVNKFIKKKKHLAVSEEKHISQLFKKKKKVFLWPRLMSPWAPS